MADTVRVTIDGTDIDVDKNLTVIQAAEKLGIEIPRYCYHPGLSIVGQCRICLVEIEKAPKLQVACYTKVADGMVVHTSSEKAVAERRSVLEFLLINHPLDCPVCDQAGECWLQNFYMEHGRYDSQMLEDKVKKSKAVPVGPHVILDSERCILCTRCVRFCDEISETHELGVFNRGDHSELLPYPGRELDNPYSGNTIDICPVGALTDRDFRFRTRVWYLSETKSICPGCSNGCNIYLHHNDKRTYKAGGARISRIKPRFNAEVNDWWICDYGRYGFGFVDDPSRLLEPMKKSGKHFQALSWEEAATEVVTRLQAIMQEHGPESVGVLLSPQLTNEDLFLAKQLFQNVWQIPNIDFELPSLETGFSDDFLIKADKNPNSAGAEIIGVRSETRTSVDEMLKAAKQGKLQALYVCQHDLTEGFALEEIEDALSRLDLLIFQGSNANAISERAHLLLPGATFVEKEGTFTNFAKRVQRINAAVPPLGSAKPDWQIFKYLIKRSGGSAPYFEASDVFVALADEVPEFAGLDYKLIGDQGISLEGEQETTEHETEQVA